MSEVSVTIKNQSIRVTQKNEQIIIRTVQTNTLQTIQSGDFFGIACSDETSVLGVASTSIPVVTMHAPFNMTLTRVFAGLRTAGGGAAQCIVDIHKNGVSIMDNTKILFSSGQKLSADGVLTAISVAQGDYLEFFLDQRDTNNVATGLKCYIVWE